MKQMLLCLFGACFLLPVTAQQVDWEKIRRADPDRVLLENGKRPTEVLLLGTFHFGYPNLDTHKTDSANFIDVLSATRQKELQELADVIGRFKPTRVYIESWNASFHDSLYREYMKGSYQLGRNEVYQVAYRVAGQMKLPKVYPVDASNFASENYQLIPKIDSMWNYSVPVDSVRDRYWDARYKRLYDLSDALESKLTMLENFLLMAEPKVLRRMHGHYLSGGFNTKGNDGPDVLAMWWYSRNLRIFNNILGTRPSGEDRILLLIGNGHVPILKHCFASSPEFKLVELKDFLK